MAQGHECRLAACQGSCSTEVPEKRKLISSLGCRSPAAPRALEQTLTPNPKLPRTPSSDLQATRKSPALLPPPSPRSLNSWGMTLSLLE